MNVHADMSLLDAVARPASAFTYTVLRDPLTRTLSSYVYGGASKVMSFKEFVESGTVLERQPWGPDVRLKLSQRPFEYQRASAQLRQLAGVTACSLLPHRQASGLHESADAQLAAATASLDRITFVGVYECMASVIDFLGTKLLPGTSGPLPALGDGRHRTHASGAADTAYSAVLGNVTLLASLEAHFGHEYVFVHLRHPLVVLS